jgi:hypothetical protein
VHAAALTELLEGFPGDLDRRHVAGIERDVVAQIGHVPIEGGLIRYHPERVQTVPGLPGAAQTDDFRYWHEVDIDFDAQDVRF